MLAGRGTELVFQLTIRPRIFFRSVWFWFEKTRRAGEIVGKREWSEMWKRGRDREREREVKEDEIKMDSFWSQRESRLACFVRSFYLFYVGACNGIGQAYAPCLFSYSPVFSQIFFWSHFVLVDISALWEPFQSLRSTKNIKTANFWRFS